MTTKLIANTVSGLFSVAILIGLISIPYWIWRASQPISSVNRAQLDELSMLTQRLDHAQVVAARGRIALNIKNPNTAFLWAAFLGGIGAHEYYLGKTKRGIIYSIFVWTGLPGFIAFIQLFKLVDRVRRENANIEIQEFSHILMLQGTGLPPYSRSLA